MGVQQSFGGVARVAFPLFLGWVFQSLGAQYPFWISATFVIATLALGRGMEHFATEVEASPPG
jgi:hypothetical protein